MESLVASGQSVAMQSMATGTPVVISKTFGFWDFENFRNQENIFFTEENSVESWVEQIGTIYEEYELLDKVAKNGQNLINEKFNLTEFSNFLEHLFEM